MVARPSAKEHRFHFPVGRRDLRRAVWRVDNSAINSIVTAGRESVMDEEKSVALWAAKKLLGPAFDTMGEDLGSLYEYCRDRLIPAATKKVPDLDDGKSAARRVFLEAALAGSTAHDAVADEYLGGILAASRTPGGGDDSAMALVQKVRSLSGSQLRLHYFIYHCLNKALIRQGEKWDGFLDKTIYLSISMLGRSEDQEILLDQGLIKWFMYDSRTIERRAYPHFGARPSTIGAMLYFAAYNEQMWWRALGSPQRSNFEDLADVRLPLEYALDLEELLDRMRGHVVPTWLVGPVAGSG